MKKYLIATGAVMMATYANAAYISNTGFIAPCTGSVYYSTATEYSAEATKCGTYCNTTYGTKSGSLYYKYGTQLFGTYACADLGYTDTDDYFCCVNNAAIQILNNCKCADENQLTVNDKTNGTSYTRTDNGDGTYDLTCQDLYCFCNTEYYGTRQLLSKSTSGACTKCPCAENTYNASTNEQLCGKVANNYITLTNNTNAPSTTITDCKLDTTCGSMPEAYRPKYDDGTGIFTLSGCCNYSE